MKDQINYEDLLALENDISHQMETSPAFKFFNREKVRRFTKNNEYRLSVLHSTMENLRDKYVMKDEKGNPVIKDVDGNKEWDFINDEDKANYLKEWNQFMQITFDLHV